MNKTRSRSSFKVSVTTASLKEKLQPSFMLPLWEGASVQIKIAVTIGTAKNPSQDLHLQSSKVVPGDAKARRFRSSSRSLVTWRSCSMMVSRLSTGCRLSFVAGGGEAASPLTGEPAGMSTNRHKNVCFVFSSCIFFSILKAYNQSIWVHLVHSTFYRQRHSN